MKKILALGMAMVLSLAMLTGCGSNSADSYVHDAEEFEKLNDVDSYSADSIGDMMDAMIDAIDGLNIKTSEGKAIKSTMKEMMELTDDMLSNLFSLDENKITEIEEKIDELTEKLENQVKDFYEAAKKAGVEVEDIDFDLGF